MEISKESLVSTIVAHNYKTASVFKKYEIDFCCNGNRTIETVSASNSMDASLLIDDLKKSMISKDDSYDFQSWDIAFLSDYIYYKHHKYVEEKIPEIKQYLVKICSVHGKHHPELFEINKLFIESANELTLHMKKEELILFPYFKRLSKAIESKTNFEKSKLFDTIESPISMLHEEHDKEGERFRTIAKLSHNYTPPESACNTYKITYSLLQEFEEDLHKHIHLENNILFEKGINIEKTINI